jgi:hypothetical protein
MRNPLFPGAEIEYLGRGFKSTCHRVEKIRHEQGEELIKGNPGNLVRLELTPPASGWKTGALLRHEARPIGRHETRGTP